MRRKYYLFFIMTILLLTSCQSSTNWEKILVMKNSGIVSANDTLDPVAIGAWGSEEFAILHSRNDNDDYKQATINSGHPLSRVCVTDRIVIVTINGDVLAYDKYLKMVQDVSVSGVLGCSTYSNELVLWGKNWIKLAENKIVSSTLPDIVDVKIGINHDPLILTRSGAIYRIMENELVLVRELNLQNAHEVYLLPNQKTLVITANNVYELDGNLGNFHEVYSSENRRLVITAFLDAQDYLWVITTSDITKIHTDNNKSEYVSIPYGVKKINDAYFSGKFLLIATNIGIYRLSVP